MLVFVEIELPLAICTRKGCHSSFSVCKNGRRLGKIHLHVDIWSSETDGDKDTEPHSPLESFPAEQSSDIKKKEKRETQKQDKREKWTTNFLFSAPSLPPSAPIFLPFSPSYKNKVPGRAFSSTDHFSPRMRRPPRNRIIPRAQEVGHGTEAGRQGLSWPRPGCQTGGLPQTSRHCSGYAETLNILPFIEQGERSRWSVLCREDGKVSTASEESRVGIGLRSIDKKRI